MKKLIAGERHGRILWFTFWQAAVSTLLTLAAALPGAWVFARYRFRGKQMIQSLTAVPFVLPTVVAAAAFHALLGPNGLLNTWIGRWLNLSEPFLQIHHTVWFILLAHVFYNYTVVFRIVGGFWANLSQRPGEAARMLGASPWQVFWKITFPLLRPAILAASLLVFVFCFSSFGVILILGGPRFATIEVEIYRQAVHYFNLPMAAALSLVQILFTFVLMWIYSRLQRKTSVAVIPESAAVAQREVKSGRDKLLVGVNLGVMGLLLGSPLLALLLRSVQTHDGFSAAFYAALFTNRSQSIFFVPPIEAVAYSVGFAAIALGLAVFLGLCAAVYLAGPRSRISSVLDPLFMLPLATSAVTLGFGFILALDRPPLDLRASIIIAPLAHSLVAFPFVVRSILPALRSIPKSLREAAWLLGASPWRAWRAVDLPIVGRALAVGAVFAFTISLGEFGATAFVARPQTPTMPVAIYRFLSQPGALNHGQAMAMSSLLMMVTAAGFLFLEKFRVSGVGEF
ncbi:MAG: iron ABC transporter permease [Desulfobacterales bacterium]|nr:iron ABC transporter permease [Desulfobacterales bacterium]